MTILLSILAVLVVLRLTFNWFFDDLDDLMEAVKLWFTPEIITVFRGKWGDEMWAELKIFVWLVLGVAAGFSVHAFLNS